MRQRKRDNCTTTVVEWDGWTRKGEKETAICTQQEKRGEKPKRKKKKKDDKNERVRESHRKKGT